MSNVKPSVERTVAAIIYHVLLLVNAKEKVKFENTSKILVLVIN